MSLADRLAERGEIGGRTVRITETGAVECHAYPLGPLPPGMVRVRTELRPDGERRAFLTIKGGGLIGRDECPGDRGYSSARRDIPR